MKKHPAEKTRAASASTRRHVHEAEGSVAGALAGAAVGALAGPPGAAAGAVLGGIAGALAAGALESDAVERADVDRALDAEIGVSGGDLGAPNLKHPPPNRDLYSAASSGGSALPEDSVPPPSS